MNSCSSPAAIFIGAWLSCSFTGAGSAWDDLSADASDRAAARQQAVSSAKARVARTALDVGNDCIQLHGAIGFTDEYDLSLYANRAIAIAPFGGNAADHLKRYGELKQRNEETSR